MMFSLICRAIKMFAFFNIMFAFSNKNARFLLSFSVCHCRPFSVDFLDLGVSQDSLNLTMEFKRVEVELCVQHYLHIPSQVTWT